MLHVGRSPAELCLFRGVVHVVASLATLTVSWKNATFFCVFVSVQCEPVNWKCQLTHFDVYNGRKLVVVVVTSPTGAVAKYCGEHVCLSVCLSVLGHFFRTIIIIKRKDLGGVMSKRLQGHLTTLKQ